MIQQLSNCNPKVVNLSSIKILLIGDANIEIYIVVKYLELMNIRSNFVLLTKRALYDPNSLKGLFSINKLVQFTDWVRALQLPFLILV
jgi:hypothetical protein